MALAPFKGEPNPIEYWLARAVNPGADSNPDHLIFLLAKAQLDDDVRASAVEIIREGTLRTIKSNVLNNIDLQNKIEDVLTGLNILGVQKDVTDGLRLVFAEARTRHPALEPVQ